MAFKNQVLDGNTTYDQRIIEDLPLEDIMKEYFCEEDFESFYSDVFDIEPFGDLTLPDIAPKDVNVSEMYADFLVSDSLFVDKSCQKYDDTEPEEQLFSLLEEYIQEEEDGRKGAVLHLATCCRGFYKLVSLQVLVSKVLYSTGNKTLEVQDSDASEVVCRPASSVSCQTNQALTETGEQRKTKNPRKRHTISQELSHEEQSMTTRKKRRKNRR